MEKIEQGLTDFPFHPNFRHQGIGKQLLDTMLAHLDRKSVTRILTNIDPENDSSLNLFGHRGFKVVGNEMPNYYSGATMLRLERLHP